MSIERYYSNYSLTCDLCGKRLGADSFEDARRLKTQQGWKSRKVDGEWMDICDDCLFEEKGYDNDKPGR